MNIEMIREYWWVLLILAGLAILAIALLRPRQRVRLSDSTPLRRRFLVQLVLPWLLQRPAPPHGLWYCWTLGSSRIMLRCRSTNNC